MLTERKKLACLAVLAAVVVVAVLGGAILIMHHFGTCPEWSQTPGAAKAHLGNIFLAVACLVLLVAVAGIAVGRVVGRTKPAKDFIALNKLNEELQFITAERARTAAELQELDRLFKTIINAVDCGICWKDSDCVYRGCNEAFARLLGLDRPESVLGKTDFEIEANRENADFNMKCDREVMKTAIPLLNMEETRHRPDGTEIKLLASKLPLRDSEGRINGMVGIFTDIGAGRKTQGGPLAEADALGEAVCVMQSGVVVVDASGRIVRANDYLATLLSKPAEQLIDAHICDVLDCPADHELRGIIGMLGQTASGAVSVVQHSIGRTDCQISVTPLSRHRGCSGAVVGIVDISSVTKAKKRAEHASSRKTKFLASMSRQIRTPLNSIIGFADLLRQEALSDDQAKFVGMIAASAENILAVADEIIDLADEYPDDLGEVDTPGDKARPVRLPPKETARPAGQAPGIQPAASTTGQGDGTDGKQHRILVVDDVLENRMLLEALLKKTGYRLEFAGNGLEAVKIADSIKLDLILMDIQMAGMNGLEATRTIRSHKLNATTPILAMTASITPEDEALCFDAGCDDFIRKPIKKDLLLRKVWRFIQQQEQIKTARNGGEITSFLADDPDYQKTIITFIENLPARIKEMQQALDEENLQELAFKAHALKGLGGFAGFPIYTEIAKAIEKCAKDNQIDEVRKQLNEMVGLCQRTRLAQN